MFRLVKKIVIEAAHCLPLHKGKCKQLHGHSWEVTVALYSYELNEDGMVVDFGDLKNLVQQYDHKMLNEIAPFNDVQPTSERLAQSISEQCLDKWPNVFEVVVSVSETDGSEVEYSLAREEEDEVEEVELDDCSYSLTINPD